MGSHQTLTNPSACLLLYWVLGSLVAFYCTLHPWMEAGLSEYFRDGTIRELSLEKKILVYDLRIEAFYPGGMIVSMLCTLVTKISTKRRKECSVNFLAFLIPSIFFLF